MLNRIGFNPPGVLKEQNTALGRPLNGAQAQPAASAQIDSKRSKETEKALKRIGIKECQTCKRRQYRDVSNDPGVSFKFATHVSPEAAAMAVSAHEQEHVLHEQVNAKLQGREIVYQAVQLSTAICPECGRIYVSGGKTITVTRKKEESLSSQQAGLLVDSRA